MTDQPTPKPMGGLTAREQEILVAALSKCLKSGDIQASPYTFFILFVKHIVIDYAKLATETGLKDSKSANAVWGPIKKKLFGIASAKGSAASGNANKVVKPKTPRKPREPKEAKTPVSSPKKALHSSVKAEEEKEEEEEAEEDALDGEASHIAPVVKVEVRVTNGADSTPASKVETDGGEQTTTADVDDAPTMADTSGSVKKGKGKASVADDMSAGDMSPPTSPAPTKAKNTATPKANAPIKTLRTPKTPNGEIANTTHGDVTETPVPGSSGAKKRGRKTKAEKEAEAAAAAENGAADNGEDDEGEKPAKRSRKAPVKKAKKGEAAQDGDIAGTNDGEDGENETPAKKPGKVPVKKPKKEEATENGVGINADADGREDAEIEKPAKVTRKAPLKKEKEDAAPTSEGTTAGEAAKEKKPPGAKLSTSKANKAISVVVPTEPDVTRKEAEHEKIHQEDAVKVVGAAEPANAVLDGKKIENHVASTTDPTARPPNWGTPVNGCSPSSSTGQAIAKPGKGLPASRGTANDEADRDAVVLASEVIESIEIDEDDDGDTIIVATQ